MRRTARHARHLAALPRRGEVTASSSSSLKGRQLQVCVSLPPEYVRRLKALSQATHESMAHYFREALRDLFAKHARRAR